MRLRARKTRLEGVLVDTSYVEDADITLVNVDSYVLFIRGIPIPPDIANERNYEILEANEREMALLYRCGWHLLDEETSQRRLRVTPSLRDPAYEVCVDPAS